MILISSFLRSISIARNACVVQTLLQILTDLVVFHEEVAEHIVLSEPTGIPILDNADTETVRIYFLAH